MLVIGLEGAMPVIIGPGTGEWVASEVCGQARTLHSKRPGLEYIAKHTRVELREHVLRLYDSLNPSIYSYALGLGLSEDGAEDVVQETFLRLATHLVSGGPESNIRSWMFQVAHNIAMDAHREVSRGKLDSEACGGMESEPADPASDPERILLGKEQLKRAAIAMSQLTPRQRSALLLRAQGLHFEEIASAMGITQQRAVVLVKKAMMCLKGCI